MKFFSAPNCPKRLINLILIPEVWTEEMNFLALHISSLQNYDLFIPFLSFLTRIRIRMPSRLIHNFNRPVIYLFCLLSNYLPCSEMLFAAIALRYAFPVSVYMAAGFSR